MERGSSERGGVPPMSLSGASGSDLHFIGDGVDGTVVTLAYPLHSSTTLTARSCERPMESSPTRMSIPTMCVIGDYHFMSKRAESLSRTEAT